MSPRENSLHLIELEKIFYLVASSAYQVVASEMYQVPVPEKSVAWASTWAAAAAAVVVA